MSNQPSSTPLVDLVIVIDTSPSMKDEAQALSDAGADAIARALSSSPVELRVVWLGIEGTWKGTRFDQTLRGYLTQQCKVAESKLRGRKAKELKSAGAQEDAARAIEDISDYFNWREGAARAIFYLGDEALEGGGDRTDQKDIVAANLAIQKAQAAGVTVNTYFGTSNSKHQEGIKSEYARLAASTGGQSFTNKDGSFSAVLEKVICGSSTAKTINLESGAEAAQIGTTEITREAGSPSNTETAKVAQGIKAAQEKSMVPLTIDTKNNCYVINADRMNHLQQHVANSFTFDKGTFDIRITGGSYKSSQSKTEGEPFVLLWIYGVDGSKFINKNTGYEVGATWTTLNGYNDNLKLEVKEKAVLCALFFDFKNDTNSGTVDFLITSDKPFFTPHTLTVDSKRNCYILDENYLRSLRQPGSNMLELNPGNYRIKIREGNASYWSDNKKFNIEPWALIRIQGGKFTTKLTGIEVEETWCSLNGLKDEVVLEVKEKTTVTGLFFDTYKEDNEGQIILAIESLAQSELANQYQKLANNTTAVQNGGRQTVTTKTVTTTSTVTSPGSTSGANIGEPQLVGGYVSQAPNFTFRFNEEEFKKKWEEQLQQINTSIQGIDEADVALEAKYWDQLEHWLLKNYEKHFKHLAVEVAKVRFSMDAYIQQMEFSLNQHLQGWSGYFDRLLEERINAEVLKRINQHIDQSFEQKLNNSIGLITQNIVGKPELKQYVDQQVNQQVDRGFEDKIRSSIGLITQNVVGKPELKQYVDQQVNRQVDQGFEQKLNNSIGLITQNVVGKPELKQYVDQQVNQQVDRGFEEKIRSSIGLITQNVVGKPELKQYVDQQVNRQVDQGFEDKIRRNVELIVNNIVDHQGLNQHIDQHVNQQVDRGLEEKIRNNVDLIVNNIANHQGLNQHINQQVNRQVDQGFEDKIRKNVDLIVSNIANNQGLNRHIDQHVNRQVDQTFGQKIRDNIGLITQNLTSSDELNQYLNPLLDNTFGQKLQDNIPAITQNIIKNNDVLNQYVDRRLQENVTNNNAVINQIFDNEQMTHKIRNILNNDSQIRDRIENLVINSPEINNRTLNFLANSTEINDKINNVYREVDNKIAQVRNDWNQAFMNLLRQYVDDLIGMIGDRESFNIRVANAINVKVDELLSQILRTRNELTALINSSDRNLYEWTLGELMAIKGCLTDRHALVEQLVSFSAELREKLDCNNCVDINAFKPFKPISINPAQQSPAQPQQLPGNN